MSDMKTRWVVLAGVGTASAIVAGLVCAKLFRPATVDKLSLTIKTPTSQAMASDTLGISRGSIGFLNPSDSMPKCRPVGGDTTDKRATASLAKLITVQVVLNKHPLKAGESGPTITMTADDEARYWHEVQSGGSYGRVVTGEQLTERQLIEGIMLVSANNMADSLAIWAFGSLERYQAAATAWLKVNHINETTIGVDASGLDATTTSTPTNLCQIALLAAKQPALAEIMSEPSVTMPTGDVFTSTNRLLGQDGIFGGKTGYNEAAGRSVILLARHNVDGVSLTTVAVSLAGDSYNAAFDGGQALNRAAAKDIKIFKIRRGEVIGSINTPWGTKTSLAANRGLITAYFADTSPSVTGILTRNHDIAAGMLVGQLTVDDSDLGLVAKGNLTQPVITWRLTH